MKKGDFVYKNKPRVFVGLSGGVDSAVSAALLKKGDHDVTGVFIKAWTPEGYPCTWKEDRRSAMRVAAVLDIPFLTLDLEKEYKKEVVDYMLAEYKAGRTPNPDVMCNKEIKFGHFLKFALDNGADFVATGHYAQVLKKKQSQKTSLKKSSDLLVHKSGLGQTFLDNFSGLLLEGSDKNKDQSYFLWTLTQKQLEHILFPIGHLQKPEVRKLAESFNLPQAERKDSQGLCFLGKVDMKEFLSRYISQKRGDVLNLKGEVIGWHNGALFFTIGERHGFTITKKTENKTPLYVIAKDIEKNIITVASGQELAGNNEISISSLDAGKRAEAELQDTNWVAGKIPDANKKYSCRLRYRQEKVPCKIAPSEKHSHILKNVGMFSVLFEKPQAGMASGQSLVLYDRETCLGGGIIK